MKNNRIFEEVRLIFLLLTLCIVSSCKSEDLRDNRASNIANLTEIRNRVLVHHIENEEYPVDINKIVRKGSKVKVSVIEGDLFFITDQGRAKKWVYSRPKKGALKNEIVICSPEPSGGKWLCIDLSGNVKLYEDLPKIDNTQP